MPQYQLNVDFDTQDLKTIASASERLVIMKQTDGGTPVAWVTIEPFNSNTVVWEETMQYTPPRLMCKKVQPSTS